MDLRERDRVGAALDALMPEWIFNLAGYGVDRSERDPDEAERLNTELPATLADWVGQRSGSGRLVHVGSALEYGAAGGHLDEEGPALPTEFYGRTKLGGTRAVRERARSGGAQAATVRLFMVYGPGEHPTRLLPSLIDAAASGETLRLSEGLQERDFVFVGDVTEGLLRYGATDFPAGEIVNLATGRLSSVRQFAETAARILGLSDEQLRFGALPTRPEEMEHASVSTLRMANRTGWTPPTTIEQGIAASLPQRGDG